LETKRSRFHSLAGTSQALLAVEGHVFPNFNSAIIYTVSIADSATAKRT